MNSPGSSPTGDAGLEMEGAREGGTLGSAAPQSGGPWNDGFFPSHPWEGVRLRGNTRPGPGTLLRAPEGHGTVPPSLPPPRWRSGGSRARSLPSTPFLWPLRPDLLLQPRGALSHQPVHPPVSVSRNK